MKYFFVIFFFLSIEVFSQSVSIEEENLKIAFVKTRNASNFISASSVIVKGESLGKFFIKVKIETLDNKKIIFDPNKFSIVENNYKLRFRPTDILYQYFTEWVDFVKVSKTKSSLKRNDYLFKPEIEDTYLSIKIDSIKNYETPVNFGTNNKPDIHIIHFKPSKMKEKKIMIYFPFPSSSTEGTLYYGNKKITDLILTD